MSATEPQLLVEVVALDSLTRHPRNYRIHPEDQLLHIKQSLQDHGQYRNVVVSRDGTILAGHGVWLAAQQLGWPQLSIIRLPLDPEDPRAIKVLTGDNEIAGRAEVDDRLLADLLREVVDLDDLVGTGYTPEMLANLVLVTRSEIEDQDVANHWVGLPDYQVEDDAYRLWVTCDSEAERAEVLQKLGITGCHRDPQGQGLDGRYPPREREDRQSLRWVGEPGEEPA